MRIAIIVFALSLMLGATESLAENGRKMWDPVEVKLALGSDDPKMQQLFNPSRLHFKVGTFYRLVIYNPSNVTHFFSSGELSRQVISRKLVVLDREGNRVRKATGLIRKLEVGPGMAAEWTFLPYKLSRNVAIYCALPEHKRAGMAGQVEISHGRRR